MGSVKESSLMSPHTSAVVLLAATALFFIIPPSQPSSLTVDQLGYGDQSGGLDLAEANIQQYLDMVKSRIRLLKKRAIPNGHLGKIRILKTSDPPDYYID